MYKAFVLDRATAGPFVNSEACVASAVRERRGWQKHCFHPDCSCPPQCWQKGVYSLLFYFSLLSFLSSHACNTKLLVPGDTGILYDIPYLCV